MEATSLFFLSGSPPPSEQGNRPLKESAAKKALFSPFSPGPMDSSQRIQDQRCVQFKVRNLYVTYEHAAWSVVFHTD